MNKQLDNAIEVSLRSFWADIQRWYGREREMISLFCFRHLIERLREGHPLHDRAQIGIEVAVPQLPKEVLHRSKCKRVVCKDIVIWAEGKMNVWDADGKPWQEPLAVMEWTVINKSDGKRTRDKEDCRAQKISVGSKRNRSWSKATSSDTRC
jgi:hypothetical protein